MARNRRAFQHSQTTTEPGAPPVWKKLSPAKLEKIKQTTEQQIDEFMEKVGYTNPAERTDEDGWRWFNYGSAKGRAGIVAADSTEETFLRVESMVTELPSGDDEQRSLMRELLQANMTIAGSARLGISGNGIFVCATIPLVELVPGDVPAHIHSVMAISESVHSLVEQVEQAGESEESTPAVPEMANAPVNTPAA